MPGALVIDHSNVRLAAFVRAELGKPFEWGVTNCVALALRALDAKYETALHIKHRHHMSSALRALAWTRKHGVSGVVDELLADGLVKIKPEGARYGDVLLGYSEDGQIAAHVSLGSSVLSSTEAAGVVLLPLSKILPSMLAVGFRKNAGGQH